MTRYEQRRLKRMQNPEFAAGYRAMGTEMQLVLALEALAERMGKKREAISRLLSSENANPTLETMIELLSASHITADIMLRETKEGEGPLHVVTELPS